MSLQPIERSVHAARRRLFAQLLLNRLAVCWSLALVLGLGWVIAEPAILDSAADNLKWYVVGALLGAGTIAAIFWARAATPPLGQAALEVDNRFGLKERVTTALGLSDAERATPAGVAVVADATAKVAPIAVKEKFPVAPRWHSAFVPVLAACLALAVLFPIPLISDVKADDEADPTGAKLGDAATLAKEKKKDTTPFTQRNKPPELANRPDKSKELKELEEEINKVMQKFDTDPNRETTEKQRDKATELTSLEEKVKKFNEEKANRLEKMEQQLQQLDRLNKDDEFQQGPAEKLNDALSKGDLKKAQDELDTLKKKLKDKELSKEDQEKLAKQMDKMKKELEQLNRNKEREDKLKKQIEKAKQEGREQDAESLERELDQLQKESKEAADTTKQLAEQFKKAQQALDKGDLEEAAKQLEQAAKQLQQTEGDLQDLEDAEQFLQRLKGEKEAACKACQGDSDKPGERKDYASGAGIGSGLRDENKDAKTGSEDQRLRGIFDPRGKKTYGGATKGPAFKKATTAELGPAISAAAQDAPKAADSQRLPRDAKDSVKEYFQSLGGQSPGGNK